MSNQSSTYLSSGDVAKATGVGRETLRFYEEKGLVKPVSRTTAGYRQYAPNAVELIAFIKATQEAGFALKEIDELLRLRTSAMNTCGNVSEALNRKLASVDAEIATLQLKRGVIQSMVSDCCKDLTSVQPCTLLPCCK